MKPHLSSPKSIKHTAFLAGVALGVLMLAVAALLRSGAQSLKEADTERWTKRLASESAITAQNLENWLQIRQQSMTQLAENPTLQLYMTEWSQSDGNLSAINDEEGQRFYANQLLASQMQHFAPPSAAEVASPAGTALVVSDSQGRPVFGAGPISDALRTAIIASPTLQNKTDGPVQFTFEDDHFLAWRQPISSIQPLAGEAPVGYVSGLIPLEGQISFLLQQENQLWPEPRASYLFNMAQHEPIALASEHGMSGEDLLAQATPITGSEWVLLHAAPKSVLAPAGLTETTALAVAVLGLLLLGSCGYALSRQRSRAEMPVDLGQAARQQKSLESLIGVIVEMVDSRDPHTAHHSQQVAKLSKTLAQQMGYDSAQVRLAELSGLLMNVGKVLVSDSVINTLEKLSPSQKLEIRSTISHSADLMEGIEVGGPIAKVIRQSQEHVDGSGLQGLKQEAILPAARIIMVANSFVAMVHKRKYRDSMSVDEALNVINELADKQFDPAVVATLDRYLNLQGGRAEWQRVAAADSKLVAAAD